MVTKRQKENLIKKHRVGEKDTGSPEVQIAILSKRIEELTKHLKTHHKDIHSRRGLLQIVADRRTHLRYLRRKSQERYEKIAKALGVK